MKQSRVCRILSAALILTTALFTCACNEVQKIPVNVIETVPEETTPATIIPAAPSEMTLDKVFSSYMSTTLAWSHIKHYPHTEIDDGTAEFTVIDDEYSPVTLYVEYTALTDTVTVAQLRYKTVDATILTDDHKDKMLLLKALNDADSPETTDTTAAESTDTEVTEKEPDDE